jgi:hypothetical protein
MECEIPPHFVHRDDLDFRCDNYCLNIMNRELRTKSSYEVNFILHKNLTYMLDNRTRNISKRWFY